jgi:hypothetical protein
VPIIAGEFFMLEVPGMADQRVRMVEPRPGVWCAKLPDGRPIELREGLRAAFDGREMRAKIHP